MLIDRALGFRHDRFLFSFEVKKQFQDIAGEGGGYNWSYLNFKFLKKRVERLMFFDTLVLKSVTSCKGSMRGGI